MKQQAIDILENIKKRILSRTPECTHNSWYIKGACDTIETAVSELQALWDGWIPEKNSCNK